MNRVAWCCCGAEREGRKELGREEEKEKGGRLGVSFGEGRPFDRPLHPVHLRRAPSIASPRHPCRSRVRRSDDVEVCWDGPLDLADFLDLDLRGIFSIETNPTHFIFESNIGLPGSNPSQPSVQTRTRKKKKKN